MLQDVFHKPHLIARLRASVLGEDLDELASVLRRIGYKAGTIQHHLYVAVHIAHWLAAERFALRSFDEAAIRRFADEHLPRCRCPVPRGQRPYVAGVAPHLLAVLRARGRIAPARLPPPTPIDAILSRFTKHLRAHRGATASTCERYARDVRLLLEQVCGRGRLDLSRLTAATLRAFVRSRASRWSPRTARRSAVAVRSFLRFLHLEGRDDGALADAVPTVRDARRSSLPKSLSTAQLRQLLAAVPRSRPTGLRDLAMLLCLARLGMRAKEVAGLHLDDIDWRAGTIVISVSKGRRASVLPLPRRVGTAIAAYLQRGRPTASHRFVFVRHLFPVGAPLRSANVTHAIARAFQRAAVTVPSRGAHALRHTAATYMVRAGATLKAVADVLRHRSIDTTAIYATVDVRRLREVALPWPEVRS
jgi:site-specific recombinase XerD